MRPRPSAWVTTEAGDCMLVRGGCWVWARSGGLVF